MCLGHSQSRLAVSCASLDRRNGDQNEMTKKEETIIEWKEELMYYQKALAKSKAKIKGEQSEIIQKDGTINASLENGRNQSHDEINRHLNETDKTRDSELRRVQLGKQRHMEELKSAMSKLREWESKITKHDETLRRGILSMQAVRGNEEAMVRGPK
jgi:hypothetical protein